ncbi:NAD(P)-dependent oxidoreductase [Sphingomonas sp. PR090111-T3T-6A]|uniref:2-hydroxyacid dehydrogenase n=1 Tax=Sphingomonas sp. PR090111-T3T-6A TaxID=685778 RepID=UPI000373A304
MSTSSISADKPVILVAAPVLARVLPLLAAHYEVLPLWEESSHARIAEARALVVIGETPLDTALVEQMPNLGLIACFTVGYDGIDVEWAKARGLAVTHAPGANDEDVADHAIGLILGHRRQIVAGDRMVRAGTWDPHQRAFTRSLAGAKLGIVGLGDIGVAVARRAEAMRMRIGWWGPNPKPEAEWPRADSLVALAHESDILVVAARAHAGNAGLISAEAIEALGPEGLLVNIARGSLVDEDALIAALKDGRLGGAALDVFETEPTPAARWADVPRTVFTPHTAGSTQDAVQRMVGMLFANLAAFFAGEPLKTPAA